MATGVMKRWDTEPSPVLFVKNSAGGDYDLTDHSAVVVMIYPTTLYADMDNSQITMQLPAAVVDKLEVGDEVLIHHERISIDAVPTQPVATAYAEFTVTRGVDNPGTGGAIISTTDVAGTGANVYRLGANATFTLTVDLTTTAGVTVTAASTSTNNTIADLVADVQTAVDNALGAGVATVTNQNDKLVITSDSTGTGSIVALSSPNSYTTDELGLVACYGVGEAARPTDPEAHEAGDTVRIIKIDRRPAIIEYPATEGQLTFEWVAGDTDKTGTFYIEFEITTPQNKQLTVPNNNTFTVEIVEDYDDR